MRTSLKNILFITFFIFSPMSFAHKDLKGGKPIEGSSLLHLESVWIDSEGKQLSFKDLVAEPFLLTMAYTRCASSCPLIVDDVLTVKESLPPSSQKIKVVLVSFDSDHETAETMKKYREKMKLTSEWKLLKGEADAVAELAAVLGVKFKKLPKGEYVHSNSIFLVNKDGVVIAQKDGLKSKNQNFISKIIEQTKTLK